MCVQWRVVFAVMFVLFCVVFVLCYDRVFELLKVETEAK